MITGCACLCGDCLASRFKPGEKWVEPCLGSISTPTCDLCEKPATQWRWVPLALLPEDDVAMIRLYQITKR